MGPPAMLPHINASCYSHAQSLEPLLPGFIPVIESFLPTPQQVILQTLLWTQRFRQFLRLLGVLNPEAAPGQDWVGSPHGHNFQPEHPGGPDLWYRLGCQSQAAIRGSSQSGGCGRVTGQDSSLSRRLRGSKGQ